MPRAPSGDDPDDFFADTRMSFGDHIEELRTHLIRAIVGFLAGMAVSLLLGNLVVEFITAPVEAQLVKFYERRAKKLGDELQVGSKQLDALNQPTPMPVLIS